MLFVLISFGISELLDSIAPKLFAVPINSCLSIVVRSPTPFGVSRSGCWLSRRFQLPRAFPSFNHFLPCCPLNGCAAELEATSLSSDVPHALRCLISFCSILSFSKFLAASIDLSLSTANVSNKVAYPMLKHLPYSGMEFLHVFNFSWFLHSFPSIWKTFSTIPIHKIGKLLDSYNFFRPISLTSGVLKLFERIILSHLLFFFECNSILSPRQAGFRPGRPT